MTDTELSASLATLERSARRWRVVAVCSLIAACTTALFVWRSSRQPHEIRLDNGSRELTLTSEALIIKDGDKETRVTAEGFQIGEHSGTDNTSSTAINADGITISTSRNGEHYTLAETAHGVRADSRDGSLELAANGILLSDNERRWAIEMRASKAGGVISLRGSSAEQGQAEMLVEDVGPRIIVSKPGTGSAALIPVGSDKVP